MENNKVIMASNNKHKIKEFNAILNKLGIAVISQKDAGIDIDVEETGTTFKGNAIIKAKAIYDILKTPVISDDSGLLIDYLDGMPGVYSHRYLGENTPAYEKCSKILELMKNAKENERSARFVCAICYIDGLGNVHTFEGKCEGNISTEIRGSNGFMYDMIFEYKAKTFAEMSEDEKDMVSHRKNALDQFVNFLNNN